MNATYIFFLQVALNTLAYVLLAVWYVAPWLARLPRTRSLMPLLAVHAFRTVGLVFLLPGVVGSRLPDAFAVPAAYGDLLAAVLALIALLALRAGWRAAPVLVWLFSLEGTADLLNVFVQGTRVNLVAGYALGPAWFIPTVIVPALLVAHALIFWQLLRPQRSARLGRANAADVGMATTPGAERAI